VITSRTNPIVKAVRALRQRKERQTRGLFLVEGIKHVGEALEAGGKFAAVESLLYAPELLTSSYAQELIQVQSSQGIPCHALSAQIFETLAEKENPQGLLAVVRLHTWSLVDLKPSDCPWGIALIQPQDPGNIGAILRTVDAVGAGGMLLLDSSADYTHPGAVRASMGALFWHPVIKSTFVEFVRWAKEHGYALVGTSAHGSVDYRSVDRYPLPLFLLMGSERQGLSPEQAAACDQVIRLPMHGRVTSLNLAVAAGIILYDIHQKISSPIKS
jgi:TrmH family RNA methyltransferase